MESDLKSDYDLQSASTGCETRLDLFENRLFSIKLTLPYAFEYISFYRDDANLEQTKTLIESLISIDSTVWIL